MTTPRLHLPEILFAGREDDAVAALRAYYRGDDYTGSAWDAFDPGATRAESADVFTADDALSPALLSTPLKGRAVRELLGTQREPLEALLRDVGPDRDFIDVDPDPAGDDMKGAYALYEALKELSGVGPTIASKLIARKRPRLFAIIDADLRRTVFQETRKDSHLGRRLLREELSKDDRALWNRLAGYRQAAGLDAHVSTLRVFDVLAWMDATGRA